MLQEELTPLQWHSALPAWRLDREVRGLILQET